MPKNTAQKLTVFRAFLVVLKWTLFGAVPLAGAYYVVQHVMKPVKQELEKPKGVATIVDKDASVLVQAVQQTRLTVAKHDENTEYLDQIADAAGPEQKTSATGARRAAGKPPVRSTAGMSRVEAAVEMIKIGAVIDGAPPRLLIDGKVVRPGEMVNEALGLRFHGLDPEAHAVLLVNQAGRIFRRSY